MRLRLSDVARFALLAGLAFALAYGLPRFGGSSSVTSVYNMLLLFSFLVGFFINRALERRKAIWNGAEVELSRLRRIYNFCGCVSDAEWGKRLHQALVKYHLQVGADLFAYPEALDDYRAVAQMIYHYEPKTARDAIVFNDLLETTRDIALERRPLERSLDNRLPAQSWMVIGFIVAAVFVLLLMNRGQGMTAFSVSLTMTGILAVLDLLWRTDAISKEEVASLQRLYRDNVPSR